MLLPNLHSVLVSVMRRSCRQCAGAAAAELAGCFPGIKSAVAAPTCSSWPCIGRGAAHRAALQAIPCCSMKFTHLRTHDLQHEQEIKGEFCGAACCSGGFSHLMEKGFGHLTEQGFGHLIASAE